MAVKRRKRGRGVDQEGRSKAGSPFVMIEHWMFDCPAYRALKPGPRVLLFELIRRYNGTNNGRIGLGVREAARAIGLRDDEAAARHFRTLEATGFIICIKNAGFNMKSPIDRTAREWRLTWLQYDGQPPTKDFMRQPCNQRTGKAGLARPEKPDSLDPNTTCQPKVSTEKPVFSLPVELPVRPDNPGTCRFAMGGCLHDAF